MLCSRKGSWVRKTDSCCQGGICYNIKQNLHQGWRPKVWGVSGMLWEQQTTSGAERENKGKK